MITPVTRRQFRRIAAPFNRRWRRHLLALRATGYARFMQPYVQARGRWPRQIVRHWFCDIAAVKRPRPDRDESLPYPQRKTGRIVRLIIVAAQLAVLLGLGLLVTLAILAMPMSD